MSAKEERTDIEPRTPRVQCAACEFAWYSAAMAEGLRSIGSCPRCGGELRFRDAGTSAREDTEPSRFAAPQLALGIPRPRRR